jgi:hypothetical protein
MSEVGLVRYDRLAMEVGRSVLPAQRTRFSKHVLTQPQFLAMFCLMRYEDWTFREAEVRLREHIARHWYAARSSSRTRLSLPRRDHSLHLLTT